MSGELEAAGAAVEAGLVAREVEGREGTRHGDGKCLNCGADVSGRYCASCGQPAHVHRTLGHVFEEFLHGVVHFDTKAWRTLPMLVARPGTLTHDYIHGKRARYISPFAMFLFTIFLMFFVFALAMPQGGGIQLGEGNLRDLTNAELTERIATLREGEAETAREIQQIDQTRPGAAGIRNGLEATREAIVRRRLAVETEIARREGRPPPEGAENARNDGSLSDEISDAAEEGNVVLIAGADALNEKFREKLENPDLLFYKIQQNAYKFSFLLLPISLPFVGLLFLWRRGHTFYDHTVFTLYSLAFMSLLFITVSLAAMGGPWTSWAIGWLVMLGIPVHMFFHVGGTYKLGVWSALWRTFFLLIFALISLTIFIALMIVFGVLG